MLTNKEKALQHLAREKVRRLTYSRSSKKYSDQRQIPYTQKTKKNKSRHRLTTVSDQVESIKQYLGEAKVYKTAAMDKVVLADKGKAEVLKATLGLLRSRLSILEENDELVMIDWTEASEKERQYVETKIESREKLTKLIGLVDTILSSSNILNSSIKQFNDMLKDFE